MTTSILDTIQNILKAQDLCVLATCAEGKPHCSLMAYLCNDTATMVYMVTLKRTQKYRNLLLNPHTSLLVDTRSKPHPSGRVGTQALTVTGTFLPIQEKIQKEKILEEMALKHPHLHELLADDDAELIAIQINSFLLLDGALEKHFVAL